MSVNRAASAAGLMALAVALAACGSSNEKASSTAPVLPSSAAPTPGTAVPTLGDHAHGTSSAGGLTIADPLPTGTAHPNPVTAQDQYKLGVNSTFAISGRFPGNYIGFGTGFLVDKAGAMGITNAHVVEGLTAIKGRFNDGTEGALHVMATDPCTDLAVVHFSEALPATRQALTIGSSDSVQPGDEVTVLGYPSSLADPSKQKLLITEGLVQATKVVAEPPGSPTYKDTIQHGATVNHGNSGGPLLNHHGYVVGINTLTALADGQDIQGQFYSIAMDSARQEIVDHLLKGESQNNLGWALDQLYPSFFEDSSEDPEQGKKLDAALAKAGVKGMYIRDVTAGAGAGAAGIKPGDLITAIQNTDVTTPSQVCDIIESVLPGTTISVDGLYLYGAVPQADPSKFGTTFHAEFVTPGNH